ncbi:hypothetical protein B0H13DRAFT_1900857 [Mycena leptocephala]|nr:hypothetical protein B0H13DRAFT_1900857 [Mycena leptocephala]
MTESYRGRPWNLGLQRNISRPPFQSTLDWNSMYTRTLHVKFNLPGGPRERRRMPVLKSRNNGLLRYNVPRQMLLIRASAEAVGRSGMSCGHWQSHVKGRIHTRLDLLHNFIAEYEKICELPGSLSFSLRTGNSLQNTRTARYDMNTFPSVRANVIKQGAVKGQGVKRNEEMKEIEHSCSIPPGPRLHPHPHSQRVYFGEKQPQSLGAESPALTCIKRVAILTRGGGMEQGGDVGETQPAPLVRASRDGVRGDECGTSDRGWVEQGLRACAAYWQARTSRSRVILLKMAVVGGQPKSEVAATKKGRHERCTHTWGAWQGQAMRTAVSWAAQGGGAACPPHPADGARSGDKGGPGNEGGLGKALRMRLACAGDGRGGRAEATWAAFVERAGVVQRQGHDAAVARSTFGEFVVARGDLLR